MSMVVSSSLVAPFTTKAGKVIIKTLSAPLTNGLHSVFLTNIYLADSNGMNRKCTVSFIDNNTETRKKIQQLVSDGMIGVLHVADQKINSLTLRSDTLKWLVDLSIDKLYIIASDTTFKIDNPVRFRQFKDDQYQQYTSKHFPYEFTPHKM